MPNNTRLESSAFSLRVPTSIALIDGRFFHWLRGEGRAPPETAAQQPDAPAQQTSPPAHPLHRAEPLTETLTRHLQSVGEHARVVRIVWYDSEPVAAPATGQVVRLVPPDEADGGAGLVLAMARDALQLAEQRACEHLLIASDDDRLLATIDAVQGKGVRVHALADESAADLPLLAQSDPNWASLLRQVDSRLIWAEAAAAAPAGEVPVEPVRRQHGERERWGARPRGFGAGSSFGEAEAVHAQAVMETVQGWLADLTPDARADIAAQLPLQRGLPQEADRELLQRLSQRLGRTVSVPERKLMRERARQGLEAQQEAAVPMAAAD